MKIILAGGRLEANFIINEFKKSNHQLIIINPDKEFAKYLSAHHDLPVFAGDPTKIYVLEDAQIKDADVFIALSENDTDNYIMSMSAKKFI
jgi:trk system potassium uptake protein TrkA